jgi:hypothetical protein
VVSVVVSVVVESVPVVSVVVSVAVVPVAVVSVAVVGVVAAVVVETVPASAVALSDAAIAAHGPSSRAAAEHSARTVLRRGIWVLPDIVGFMGDCGLSQTNRPAIG